MTIPAQKLGKVDYSVEVIGHIKRLLKSFLSSGKGFTIILELEAYCCYAHGVPEKQTSTLANKPLKLEETTIKQRTKQRVYI